MTPQDKKAFHILFVGFMGSGKTTVSSRLGRMFSRRVIDLDKLIARRAGKSIPKIFAEEGQEGFRYRETAALESLLSELPCIVSCGGGVVIREENRALLKKLGTVVYLQVGASEAVSRISHPESRPLLSGPLSPAEILKERLPLYEEVADITVDTSGRSIEEVV
ncbi:MAG: shikimate kinase, partial [Actinobacteria bacterium]|nr:shikimate kinase [Actinomycetota bacterium]